MDLAHFRMLIILFLNKDTDIVPEEAPIIILDSKSDVFMVNNGKDNKHTSHIPRRLNFVRKDEKYKIHNIVWCEGGLEMVDIATNNVGDNYLNPRMKYIMVIIENW